MRILRALPLLAAFTCPAALAEPSAADITRLLQNMQERLATLEARNAELDKRLADAGKAAALAARVEDVENELVALRKQPDPLARLSGITAGASMTVVGQDASGGGLTGAGSQLSTRYDVEVELPGGSIGAAEGKLFAHFRGGDGAGISAPSYSSLNATAFGNQNSPVLMQAWYQLDIPVGADNGNLGRIEATVGKIDPFGFFDGNNVSDDESEGFLNLAFVHNPLLDAGGDIGVGQHGTSPGLRLAYVSDINGGDHVTASLGVFGTGTGANYTGTFHKPFSIAQLEYNGKVMGLEGSYRAYAWNNSQAFDRVNDLDANGAFDDTPEKHTGWGVSLDQQVTDSATLFARYGRSSRGTMAFDRAVTLGGQLAGAAWGRPDDRVGLAFGWLPSSKEMKAANAGFGTERETELFYVWQANEHVHLTPSVQWIDHPGGNPNLKDVTVLGLRMKASY